MPLNDKGGKDDEGSSGNPWSGDSKLAVSSLLTIAIVTAVAIVFYVSAYRPYVDSPDTSEPTTTNPVDSVDPLADVSDSQPIPETEPIPATEPLTASIISIISDETLGVAPVTFDFEANATGGKAPYSYSWDFGDFTEEDYGKFVSHEFEDAGDYYVELTVTDAEGETASYGIDITVD